MWWSFHLIRKAFPCRAGWLVASPAGGVQTRRTKGKRRRPIAAVCAGNGTGGDAGVQRAARCVVLCADTPAGACGVHAGAAGKTRRTAAEMNEYFARGYTPKVRPGKHCNACSLKEICLPALCRKNDVNEYIRTHLAEQNTEEAK